MLSQHVDLAFRCELRILSRNEEAHAEAAAAGSKLPASFEEVSAAVQERLGFTLYLAPSSVPHESAGEGVWLRGKAQAGAVVGLYPGITYTRGHYRSATQPLFTLIHVDTLESDLLTDESHLVHHQPIRLMRRV